MPPACPYPLNNAILCVIKASIISWHEKDESAISADHLLVSYSQSSFVLHLGGVMAVMNKSFGHKCIYFISKMEHTPKV